MALAPFHSGGAVTIAPSVLVLVLSSVFTVDLDIVDSVVKVGSDNDKTAAEAGSAIVLSPCTRTMSRKIANSFMIE